MTKPIAVYSRISDEDQDHAAQESVLTAWLSASGIDPAKVEWYRDTECGDTMARPQMARMEKDIFNGRVKTVVVYKLDRISRNMLDGMNFVGRLCDRGVRFVSVTQHLDVTGTMGRMMAAMLFGFAEMEQETRRERQAHGINVAKAKGVYKGRKAGTTKATPERAKELRGKGLSVQEVATALGVSVPTAYRYLS